jgi:hypothetical protein
MRKDLEAQVIAKAWADESFKKALVSSPRSAVENEFGIKLPASVNVRVVEESTDNLYLVLPLKNAAAERGELSDLELEAVAGGKAGCMGDTKRTGAEHLEPAK